MYRKNERRHQLTISVLSLSLLTVMAGAAVAPALNVIRDYFSGVDQTLIQMIISMPALFIALTSLIFPKLCRTFKSKELVMAGLLLYTAGGCAAGLFSNIYLLLFFIGGWVGIIAGSVCVGFANGAGIPFIMSTAGQRAGRSAAATVMPLLSMAMYLAQFVTPMVLSVIGGRPYAVAACSAALFLLWSFTIKGDSSTKDAVAQE